MGVVQWDQIANVPTDKLPKLSRLGRSDGKPFFMASLPANASFNGCSELIVADLFFRGSQDKNAVHWGIGEHILVCDRHNPSETAILLNLPKHQKNTNPTHSSNMQPMSLAHGIASLLTLSGFDVYVPKIRPPKWPEPGLTYEFELVNPMTDMTSTSSAIDAKHIPEFIGQLPDSVRLDIELLSRFYAQRELMPDTDIRIR